MLVLLDTREVIDGELRLGGLRLVDNVDAGDWVVAGTHGWSVVHQLVPEVFEAYARVFHPAYRQVEDDEETQAYAPTSGRLIPGTTRAVTVYGREVRWAEVAEANRRVAHPAMEWASIAGDHGFRWGGEQPGRWDEAPAMGTLPLRHTERLCELLANHTQTTAPGASPATSICKAHTSGGSAESRAATRGRRPARSLDRRCPTKPRHGRRHHQPRTERRISRLILFAGSTLRDRLALSPMAKLPLCLERRAIPPRARPRHSEVRMRR